MSEWRKYNSEWHRDGASAVLMTHETLENLTPLLSVDEPPTASILAAAKSVSVEKFFAKQQSELRDDECEADTGTWPENPVPTTLQAHRSLSTGKPYPEVYLAKIPTTKSWEIPAYLKFGGWNACPSPEEQVAVLRYWAERYGVEVYSISSDVMECAVARPPQTKEDALALAQEQFLFCSDIVHQGTETLSVLAASIQNSEAWFFWWD